jgi:hypothetical protein
LEKSRIAQSSTGYNMRLIQTVSLVRAVLIACVFACFGLFAGAPADASTLFTGGAGTQSDPFWSVTVQDGINLIEWKLYTGSTTPAGPANQGYTTGSGHLLDWIQNTAGFSTANLVANGQITTKSFTAIDANLFAVHFGCGRSGPCELVWLFSGDTTFTVNSLNGFSNISAFDPIGTPLPTALPLFGGGLGALGLLGWRRKRKARAGA